MIKDIICTYIHRDIFISIVVIDGFIKNEWKKIPKPFTKILDKIIIVDSSDALFN